jgi:predicted nucleic acid-binding protein
LNVIGTVGLLLRAKSSSHIVSVKGALDALSAAGIRVSAPLQTEALRLAGEQ